MDVDVDDDHDAYKYPRVRIKLIGPKSAPIDVACLSLEA